jgi:hypothetical protein
MRISTLLRLRTGRRLAVAGASVALGVLGLAPASALAMRGTVLASDGRPLAHKTIWIYPEGESSIECELGCLPAFRAVTDNRGRYAIPYTGLLSSMHGYADAPFRGDEYDYSIPLARVGGSTNLRAVVNGSGHSGWVADVPFTLTIRPYSPSGEPSTFNAFTGVIHFTPLHGRLLDGSPSGTISRTVHAHKGQEQIVVSHIPLGVFSMSGADADGGRWQLFDVGGQAIGNTVQPFGDADGQLELDLQ